MSWIPEKWGNVNPRVPDTRARILFLVRHAESGKTVMRRNGGPGLPLTERGRLDAHLAAREIARLIGKGNEQVTVFTPVTVQVLETAQILSDELGCALEIDDRLRGTSLGLLDGLSDEEIMEEHPGPSERLLAWRRGLLQYGALNLPGAESHYDFVQRVGGALERALKKDGVVIIGTTRSSGIVIRNLLDGRDLEEFVRVRISPASISVWRADSGWEAFNSTDHMGGRDFPDD